MSASAAPAPKRPVARPYAFPELVRPAQKGTALFTIESLADLPFSLDAPLGSLEIDVRRLLDLRLGSVLQLDRLTGEPLEITANGTPIARGEVRIHGERFAIRVTEILRAEAASDAAGGTGHEPSKKDGDASRTGDAGDSRARVGK